MEKFYIASTLAAPNLYTNHAKGGADLPVPVTVSGVPGVLIEGGAGVVGKHLITPEGVITEVTADQLDYLHRNEVFKLHQDNGFVKILTSKPKSEEAATGDMNHADEGRQLTEGDLVKEAEADGEDKTLAVESAGKTTKPKSK